MITTPPTIIISLPRSGSSMTAGIFAHHGAWYGICKSPDKNNPKGYYENLKAKDFMIKNFGRIVHSGIPAETGKFSREDFEQIILDDGYPNDGTPWIVKFSAMYFPPWIEAFPEANVVCVRRNKQSIIESGKKSKMLVKEEPIDPHIEMMEWAAREYDAININFENIISGDYTEIELALKEAGLEPDHRIIDDFVDPKLKHY